MTTQIKDKIIKEPNVDKLNEDIKEFWQVHPITEDMGNGFDGVGRMVMFDRYSFKDIENKTLGVGDMVVTTVKDDSQYPVRGIGIVQSLEDSQATIWVQEEYQGHLESKEEQETGIIKRQTNEVDKPMELYFEQIAARVANAQSKEESEDLQAAWEEDFNEVIASKKFVPAGRILFGSNSDSDVTLYNCFILPNPQDSREGLAKHRGISAEVMSHGK